MRRRRNNRGAIAITFAAGLLVSCFLPPKCLVAILAIWVIILGICSSRNC